MPRWQFAPFFFATAAIAAWHEVLVAIDGVTLSFDPPSITAVANDAIHFVVPNSKMMLVQAKSLAEPCTALPGGFRSVLGLGKLDVTINDTTPFYVYADLYCTKGMVFITNAANAGDYDTLLANALALAGQPEDAEEPESPAPQSETTPAPSQSSSESTSGTGTRSESSHDTSPSASPPADSPVPSNSETGVTPSESSGPPTGVIAAVAAICILGTALVAAVAFICVRRRRRSRVPAKNAEQWSVEWPPPDFRQQTYIAASSVQTQQGTSVQGGSSTRPQRSEKSALRLTAPTSSSVSRPPHEAFDSPQPSPSLFVRDSMAGSSSAASSSSGGSDATRKLEMVQELLERGVSNRAVLTALRTVNGEVVDDPSPVSAAPRMSMLKGPPPTYAP